MFPINREFIYMNEVNRNLPIEMTFLLGNFDLSKVMLASGSLWNSFHVVYKLSSCNVGTNERKRQKITWTEISFLVASIVWMVTEIHVASLLYIFFKYSMRLWILWFSDQDLHYPSPWQGHTDALSKLLDQNISLHPLISSIEELASAAKEVEYEAKVSSEVNVWTSAFKERWWMIHFMAIHLSQLMM